MLLDTGRLLSAGVKSPEACLLFFCPIRASYSSNNLFSCGFAPFTLTGNCLSRCSTLLCVVLFSLSAHKGPVPILASDDSGRPALHPRAFRSPQSRLFLESLVYSHCFKVASIHPAPRKSKKYISQSPALHSKGLSLQFHVAFCRHHTCLPVAEMD